MVFRFSVGRSERVHVPSDRWWSLALLAAPHFLERIMNLIIDPEFESLCPPLTEEEEFRHLRTDVLRDQDHAAGPPRLDSGMPGR